MTRWLRLGGTVFCGYCSQLLAAGVPVRVTVLQGVKKPRFRGECCAGATPPDLPAVIARASEPTPTSWHRVGKIPFDVKQAQAGRDPGEDDAA